MPFAQACRHGYAPDLRHARYGAQGSHSPTKSILSNRPDGGNLAEMCCQMCCGLWAINSVARVPPS